MSWQSYIDEMMGPDADGNIVLTDAAICRTEICESLLASTPNFNGITKEQIKVLDGKDREGLFVNGVYISNLKCRVLRDNLEDPYMYSMDLKTSAIEGKTYNICIGKTKTAIVIGKGTPEANGGQVSGKVCKMAEYLRYYNM